MAADYAQFYFLTKVVDTYSCMMRKISLMYLYPAPAEVGLLKFIREIPVVPLAIMAVLLALAPFAPEPHLVEKLRMLSQGTLTKPIDIFDLFLHSAPLVILVLRLTVLKTPKSD